MYRIYLVTTLCTLKIIYDVIHYFRQKVIIIRKVSYFKLSNNHFIIFIIISIIIFIISL